MPTTRLSNNAWGIYELVYMSISHVAVERAIETSRQTLNSKLHFWTSHVRRVHAFPSCPARQTGLAGTGDSLCCIFKQ